MPAKIDLIELARICIKQADITKNAKMTSLLRRMAKEYQRRAAQLERAASLASQR